MKKPTCRERGQQIRFAALTSHSADNEPVTGTRLPPTLNPPDGGPRAEPTIAPLPSAASDVTRVRFWGVRGSVPTPGSGTVVYGGNTSCVEIRAAGEIIILDAGTGLRPLGLELDSEFAEKPIQATLLLSHTHWDHIQGLPFFSPVYKPQNHLRILGYEGARNGLCNILSSQMDTPYFPIGLNALPANLQIEELKAMEFSVGAVRVQAFYANHPGICVGYRLFTRQGSIAFFPDNESRHGLYGLDPAHDTPAKARARAEDQALVEFLRGTDLLIMDSQYDSMEYARHVGWGHGCLDDVISLALRAQAKRLSLFHHDPGHDDLRIEQMTASARRMVAERNASLQVDAAKEGTEVRLGS